MEIRISALDGVRIPDDCVVNVSVGDVQKQARYDPRKLYRFKDPKRVAKIDLYQQIGSCDVTWNIDEPASVSCVATGSSGPGIKLNVNVAPVIAKDPKEKATDKSDKADASNKARQYLKDHAVEDLLTKAMRELLKAMPQDSHKFLAEYIINRGATPSSPIANAPTAAAACGSTSVCTTAAPAPTFAAKTQGKDLGLIRSQACEVLIKASNNGMLNDVLTEIMDDRPKGAPGGMSGGPKKDIGKAVPYDSKSKKDLVALRVQAADVLMKASFDGSLQTVLTEIRQEAPRQQVPGKKLAPNPTLRMLREQTCDVLMQASLDGSLEKVLSEVREEKKVDDVELAEQARGATKIQASFRGKQTRKQMNTERDILAVVEMPLFDKIHLGMPLSLPILFF